MRSILAPPPILASPFVGVPVDLGALIVQASLRRQRVFRDRTDPLALSDDILYERYRFSSEGIRYLIFLVGPYVKSMLHKEAVHLLAAFTWAHLIRIDFYAE